LPDSAKTSLREAYGEWRRRRTASSAHFHRFEDVYEAASVLLRRAA
jgi:hypothetical protein